MAKGKYKHWLEPESLILVEGWARSGLTNKEIAKNIGISEKTLYEWIEKYPQFGEALKKNKEIADYIVENALFKKATGYEYKEKIAEIIRDPRTGEILKQHIREVTKHQPPDTLAIIFFLKNRKPKEWRDKRYVYDDVDHQGGGPSAMEQLVQSIKQAESERGKAPEEKSPGQAPEKAKEQ